jgi:hypothetical protein
MIVLNEDKQNESCYNFQQILPDVFSNTLPTKPVLCVKVNKKRTEKVKEFLKNNKLLEEQVFLKNEFKNESLPDYLKTNINKEMDKYSQYDISFMKRVRPINKEENLIIVSFLEVSINEMIIE